jgi:hypothetical protein
MRALEVRVSASTWGSSAMTLPPKVAPGQAVALAWTAEPAETKDSCVSGMRALTQNRAQAVDAEQHGARHEAPAFSYAELAHHSGDGRRDRRRADRFALRFDSLNGRLWNAENA